MVTVDGFISNQPLVTRKILEALRQLILDASPQIRESIKYRIPFYTCHGLLCYLNPQPDHVALGFCRGTELSNENGWLTGNGKQVRHLRISSATEIQAAAIRVLLQEALMVNEMWHKEKSVFERRKP